MEVQAFIGGSDSLRGKLNAMREELNALSKIGGDGRYIAVQKNSSGVLVSLNIDAVRAMLAVAIGNFSNSISITIDGGGSAITTSVPTMGGATVVVPYACTIIGWMIEADASGSIVIDVLRNTAGGVPSASIVGAGTKPTLSSAQTSGDSTAPASWTSVALAQNDRIGFSVSSATTVKRVTLTLLVI